MQPLAAQFTIGKTDTWANALKNKKATIDVLWYDIEPFIYRKDNGIIGVEYELMQGFIPFLQSNYGISLTINWIDAKAFEPIYPAIKNSKEPGLFALSYFSITDDRKKEVQFSPPYMPDLNIVVSSNNIPVYDSDSNFFKDLKLMQGYTMAQTTMEEDMLKLRRFYPQLQISNKKDDYEVLNQIASYNNAFGYVPLSIYVVALQRGIKIKRQKILATQREGFAAIYTKVSDWQAPINAYFNGIKCKKLTQKLIQKHLGEEVADIILEVSSPDSSRKITADIELLTKEREIVTKRLIDTALEYQRSKNLKNILAIAFIFLAAIALVIYQKFRTKKLYAKQLTIQNEEILMQKREIEKMNRKLKQRLAVSQINPHLIYNTLTAIQYFVMMDDKKIANKYLAQLGKFLRKLLQNSQHTIITVEDEIEMIELYLSLEKMRFNSSFNFAITNSNNLGNMPSMLLFPFVEQCLYQRILPATNEEFKPKMDIEFTIVANTTIIQIKDDGNNKRMAESNESIKIATAHIEAINANQTEKILLTVKNNKTNNLTTLIIPHSVLN